MNLKAGFLLPVIAVSAWLGAAEYTVPSIKTPPVIDGRIHPGEWDKAFSSPEPAETIDPRRTKYSGVGPENLYLAVVRKLPRAASWSYPMKHQHRQDGPWNSGSILRKNSAPSNSPNSWSSI